MKKINPVFGHFICAVLVLGVFLGIVPSAYAINTVFMVPPIDKDYVHHNTLYLSPNFNISAQSWGYGTTVDILNTTGDIDSLLSEVFANVTPKGGERIMGIYTEGMGLSDANAEAIANAGWKRVELYYDTYFVSCPPVGATHPDIQLVEHQKISSVLNKAGFESDFAVLEVSGVNSTWAYLIKYDPSLSFMRGKTPHVYKYLPDLAVFSEVEEVYFDSYDRNFLEWDNPQLVEPDMNGFYLATAAALPEELVCTPEKAAELRANPPLIPNTEGNVQWKMPPGLVPESFTAEAVIVPVESSQSKANEVNVDFAYSGELPEGTQVTLSLPSETVAYTEGTELFLYYCNPGSQMREFVSSSAYTDGQVTFAIYHCSEYVITDQNHGESYMPEPEIKEEPPKQEVPAPQPPPAVQRPETPPAVQQEPVTDEPLYALPLKDPNTTRIIVFCSVGIAAAAACAAIIIVKKKK